mgnify:CR=1 FL=1
MFLQIEFSDDLLVPNLVRLSVLHRMTHGRQIAQIESREIKIRHLGIIQGRGLGVAQDRGHEGVVIIGRAPLRVIEVADTDLDPIQEHPLGLKRESMRW